MRLRSAMRRMPRWQVPLGGPFNLCCRTATPESPLLRAGDHLHEQASPSRHEWHCRSLAVWRRDRARGRWSPRCCCAPPGAASTSRTRRRTRLLIQWWSARRRRWRSTGSRPTIDLSWRRGYSTRPGTGAAAPKTPTGCCGRRPPRSAATPWSSGGRALPRDLSRLQELTE